MLGRLLVKWCGWFSVRVGRLEVNLWVDFEDVCFSGVLVFVGWWW